MGRSKKSQSLASTLSDAALIASSETNAASFGVLFDRHVDRIYAFVLRRVGPSLAEDLTAETFTRAFEQRARFVPIHESAGPWLYGIATNVVHKAWRAERRQLAAYRKTAAVSAATEDDLGAAEDRIDAERAAASLLGALDDLGRGDRDALLLFVWEELSYEEVGAALQIPAGTVASRINRARRQLQAAKESIGETSKGAV
jgi:RNA polymerase sigma factor (sigma-70 family)